LTAHVKSSFANDLPAADGGVSIRRTVKNAQVIRRHFIVFLTISVLVYTAQCLKLPPEKIDGLLVPDSVNIAKLLDFVREGNIESSVLVESQMTGIITLYSLAWAIHPATSLLINWMLIYLSLRLTADIFTKQSANLHWILLGVTGNPYVYLVAPAPNKEIPLLFLTLLFVYQLIVRPRWWVLYTIIISGAVYSIRDGYGAIVLIIAALHITARRTPRIMVIVGIVVLSVCVFIDQYVADYLSFVVRNKDAINLVKTATGGESTILGVAISGSTDPFLNVLMYYSRIVYNVTTLGVFPIFVSIFHGCYVLGWAFWVFGILIFSGVVSCVIVVLGKQNTAAGNKRLEVAVLVLLLVAAISVSSYVQPRYLMPVLPLAGGVCMSLRLLRMKVIGSVVLLCVGVMLFYAIRGYKLPLADTSDTVNEVPSFVLGAKE
jgi:hypothetical protein